MATIDLPNYQLAAQASLNSAAYNPYYTSYPATTGTIYPQPVFIGQPGQGLQGTWVTNTGQVVQQWPGTGAFQQLGQQWPASQALGGVGFDPVADQFFPIKVSREDFTDEEIQRAEQIMEELSA